MIFLGIGKYNVISNFLKLYFCGMWRHDNDQQSFHLPLPPKPKFFLLTWFNCTVDVLMLNNTNVCYIKYYQVCFIEYLQRMKWLVHAHGFTDVEFLMLFFPKADADKKKWSIRNNFIYFVCIFFNETLYT